MSATATFTSQAVAEWVKIFPRQVTETYTSSVTFMKQLTVVAVSTITYMKNVFPEDSYTVENFSGIRLRILKKKPNHDLAQFVSTAMSQAFEAFDKKYLHQMVLCFYDGECKIDNLVEYHIFEYTYNSDGVTMNVHSKGRGKNQQSTRYSFDNVRERTVLMIRACVVIMQSCQDELPESYDVSLRLYYNEDAPEGYQAPGFLSTEENQDHLEPTLPESVKLGYVETPFHKLTTRCYIRSSIGSSHEAIPSQNVPVISPDERYDFDGSALKSISDSTDTRILCACNKFDTDDDTHGLLTCQYCNTQQHAACYGITRERAGLVKQHCCTECSDADPTREPTDQRLAALGVHKRECLCIFRRALEWCGAGGALSAARVADKFQLSELNASKLMKLLHSHAILQLHEPTDVTAPHQIVPDRLKQVMAKYFQAEEPNIVDRLIAETLSQSSQHDPVGEVLSPMEKISLQNATTLGKIVEPEPEAVQVVQDETLQEYRDVIMANVEKETGLPLSGSHNPVNVEEIGKKAEKRKSDGSRRTGVRTKRARANKDYLYF
ncbi:unnamed protein product [Arctia plantaginis]|uniref:HORMA domain-containing protein n=1 Tax=Arctia plantaginis TaxID=874455 RepID=A0A8S0Z771_ARCPL|nr:unnamed protein product [Arctia plantaginis]